MTTLSHSLLELFFPPHATFPPPYIYSHTPPPSPAPPSTPHTPIDIHDELPDAPVRARPAPSRAFAPPNLHAPLHAPQPRSRPVRKAVSLPLRASIHPRNLRHKLHLLRARPIRVHRLVLPDRANVCRRRLHHHCQTR